MAVIHNGIIENFARLRAELEADGVEFASETDTECAAHLLAPSWPAPGRRSRPTAPRLLTDGDAAGLPAARGRVHAARGRRRGTPGAVVGARRNSPLVVGPGDGENFLGHDVAAFIEHTREALELGQDQIVAITADGDRDHRLRRPARRPASDFHVDWDASAAEKGGYDWFMLKEIDEQPQRGRRHPARPARPRPARLMLDEVRITDQDLRDVDKIVIVACGTAYYAGLVAKYAIEHWTRIPCEVELASEFRYRDPVLDRSTLVVAISQSGETMDTLMALRHAREQRARVLAICNTNGSTIPRESDAVLYTHAGPEIAVASTKAFLTQIVACYLLGLYLAQVRGIKYADEVARRGRPSCRRCPAKLRRAARPDRAGPRAGPRAAADARSVLFLGRHVGYPVALEGALKLKELAYIHAEGFAAGELKHGPIALIEPGHAGVLRRAVAGRPGHAARQGGLQHPGDPRPRRPDHRDRRGGRRRRRAVRRPR